MKFGLNEVASSVDEIMPKKWTTKTVLVMIIIAIIITVAYAKLQYNINHFYNKVSYSLNNTSQKLDALSTSFANYKDDIKTKFTFYQPLINTIMIAKSPLKLNEKGLQIAYSINAKEIIDRNYSAIISMMGMVDTTSAYEVQEKSFEFAKRLINNKAFFTESEFNAMRNYAYNTGEVVESFFMVFGILLRDKIIRDNDTINIK